MVHLPAVRRKRGRDGLPYKLGPRDGELFGNLRQQLEIFFRNVNKRAHGASSDIHKVYCNVMIMYIIFRNAPHTSSFRALSKRWGRERAGEIRGLSGLKIGSWGTRPAAFGADNGVRWFPIHSQKTRMDGAPSDYG
jgi:hypothetical protein